MSGSKAPVMRTVLNLTVKWCSITARRKNAVLDQLLNGIRIIAQIK